MKNLLTIIIAISFGTVTVLAQSNAVKNNLQQPVAQKGRSTSQNNTKVQTTVQAKAPVSQNHQALKTATTGKRLPVTKTHTHAKLQTGGKHLEAQIKKGETSASAKKDPNTKGLLVTKKSTGNSPVAENKTKAPVNTKATVEQTQSPELQKRADERNRVGANAQESNSGNANKPVVNKVQPNTQKTQVTSKLSHSHDLQKRADERAAKKANTGKKANGASPLTMPAGNNSK